MHPFTFDLKASPVGYHRFTDIVELNFQCNRWVQFMGGTGITDLRAVGDGPRTNAEWSEALLSLADNVRAQGRGLDAAYYERGAEFLMPPGDPRKPRLRHDFVGTLREACDVEPVLVPYDGGFLPSYDLPPAGPAKSTWVFFGGFDSYIEEFLPCFLAVAADGHRVIAFDGPGQGGALEDHHLKLTPDWGRPVSAILNHFGLDDVTLVGMSMGGALVMHAAAAEPRARRVVAWGVMDDFLEVLLGQVVPFPGISRILTGLPGSVLDPVLRASAGRRPVVEWGLWQGQHVLGLDQPSQLFRRVDQFGTRNVSSLVKGDVLLLQGAEDHYVPARQTWRQAKALTAARSVTTRTFTTEEEAANHCQVGNFPLALRTILTWEAQFLDR